MTLEQYLERLADLDPDVLVDELGLSSDEILARFKNKARSLYYKNEYEEEGDEGQDD